MMSRRIRIPRAPLHAQVNVTPMIDVMLVLLIIFMIVTPLIDSRSALPRSTHADSRPQGPDEIVLHIDREGRYFLSASGDAAAADLRSPRRIARDELAEQLGRLYHSRTVDRILYLKADSGLRFGQIEEAIAIARRAGVRIVGAVTETHKQPRRRTRG